MATLESIQARIAKLQAQAEQIVTRQASVVLDRIRELMDKHGVTVSDIDAHVRNRRGRKPGTGKAVKPAASVAKYRDPKTGATWTGRGRAPAWIATAKDRSKLLIDGASPSPAMGSGKPARVGNYVRGPQPPLYRDPKSGATWSGRGRAPAWIANAKDRSRFLIAESAPTKSTAASSRKANANGKVAVKKTAGAKAAAKKRATAAKKSKAPTRKRAAARNTVAKTAPAENVASTVESSSAS